MAPDKPEQNKGTDTFNAPVDEQAESAKAKIDRNNEGVRKIIQNLLDQKVKYKSMFVMVQTESDLKSFQSVGLTENDIVIDLMKVVFHIQFEEKMQQANAAFAKNQPQIVVPNRAGPLHGGTRRKK